MATENLHDLIAGSTHLGEEEAFRALLARPRIQAWVGDDDARRARLREEFHRAWTEQAGAVPSTAHAPRARAAQAAAVRHAQAAAYLCPRCRAVAKAAAWTDLRCRVCHAQHARTEDLVAVELVGPMALLFGPGPRGYLKAGLLLLIPLSVYAALWLLRKW